MNKCSTATPRVLNLGKAVMSTQIWRNICHRWNFYVWIMFNLFQPIISKILVFCALFNDNHLIYSHLRCCHICSWNSFLHFIDEETESLKDGATCPASRCWHRISRPGLFGSVSWPHVLRTREEQISSPLKNFYNRDFVFPNFSYLP